MLALEKLRKDDFQEIESWFNDVSFQQRLEGFYPVLAQLEAGLASDKQIYWVIFQERERLGLIELELETNTEANILVAIKKEARGKGYCQKALGMLLKMEIPASLTRINAYISRDNLPSVYCFQKAGFQLEAEEDHFLKLVNYL